MNKDPKHTYKLCNQQLSDYKEEFKKKIIDEARKYDPHFGTFHPIV